VIDLHSHILPGVDDGAPDLDTSLQMLRIAAADGTKKIVATPHQRHPAGYHVGRERAEQTFAEVRRAAEEAGIGVELALAAEIHFSPEIPEGIAEGGLLPLCPGGRYFLLELPVTSVPGAIRELVFELQTAGCFPVLAHPERNFEIAGQPEIARELRERGMPLQLTAGSITGAFGRASEKASRKLLRWGAVDVIASDAHNAGRRAPGLSESLKVAARILGADRAEQLVTENPARLLAGEGVLS
jgi:protein-tyrosine phosphatase